MAAAVRGDLGRSFRSGRPVTTEIAERLPASLALGGAGFAVAFSLGAGIAVAAALRPDGPVDHVLRVVTLGSVAMPAFLSGTLALAVLAGSGRYQVVGPASADRLWVPALVLGVAGIPTFSRALRAALLVERSRLYATAARARGASEARVVLRHTLRPALSPVLTVSGLSLASLLGGAVITESVFSWPGVGAYAVTAIHAQDYPVIQGYVLAITVLVVVINRAADLGQRVLDPRVAHGEQVRS